MDKAINIIIRVLVSIIYVIFLSFFPFFTTDGWMAFFYLLLIIPGLVISIPYIIKFLCGKLKPIHLLSMGIIYSLFWLLHSDIGDGSPFCGLSVLMSHFYLKIPLIENQSVVGAFSYASLSLGVLYILLCIILLFIKINKSDDKIKKRNFYPYIIIASIVLLLIFAAAKSNFVINLNTQNNFIKAAEDGDITEIKSLIRKGIDINTLGYSYDDSDYITALMGASKNGRTEIVEELIKDGANINIEAEGGGFTALLYASRYGHVEIVDKLIGAGVDVNGEHRGDSAIIVAVIGGNPEVIDRLVEAGADVNKRDWLGETALDYAKRNNNSEIINKLVLAGAIE